MCETYICDTIYYLPRSAAEHVGMSSMCPNEQKVCGTIVKNHNHRKELENFFFLRFLCDKKNIFSNERGFMSQ